MNKKELQDAIEHTQQTPEAYFAEIRKKLETEEKKGRELTPAEERLMMDGFALEEMTHTAGWSIVQEILQDMPKAHVDPRGMSEQEWHFAELNAFWQGTVASELLTGLYKMVKDAHDLHKIKTGETTEVRKMRV